MQPMVQFALRALRGAQEQFVRIRERLEIAREDNTLDDLLADAGGRAESLIASHFARGYPQHGLAGRYIPRRESSGESRGWEWQIELFHGYANLSIGAPGCAISLVCLHNGRPECAVVISPFTDEEFVASRGRGVQMNGHRLRVTRRTAVDGARVAMGLPESWMQARHIDRWQSLSTRLGPRMGLLRASGCPLIDLLELAAGRVDAALVLGIDEQDLHIANLMLKEAGALLGSPEGHPQVAPEGVLMAAAPRLYKQMVQAVGTGA
ncbi:inositol monophosphatase [Kushneria phosphatilytica]|uniref:Inositol monophosphatase n=2 Tax=Kushneria phosphatilytica TaxID=657387 RepID=A0A1S1NM27_9GAMM|nr:inositol monophosphatase family protein [Kushneria phosphatilytica]OHV07791.1 inositol monophosphatase [Kushneria phosphatilytica]QEL12698.1 inositol monophosphatase [Kushneria phosphatilytica]